MAHNHFSQAQELEIIEKSDHESSSYAAKLITAMSDIVIEIVHRMRSPLSAIQLYAELLRQDIEDDRREIADNILSGVHSLDAVLSNLLSFTQPVKPRFRKVDLISILNESLFFAELAIKRQNISLIEKYSHNEIYCIGDLEQLKQVYLNLILNAIQAMPDGGELHVSVSHSDDMKYINMKIEDSGSGIPDEYLDRVFTPFFTTKEGGAGLGLCVVYKIVQAHNGKIHIKSIKGCGTLVSIQLPVEPS